MLFELQILIDGRKGDSRELEDIEQTVYADNYFAIEKIAKDLIRRLLEIKKDSYLQLSWNEVLTDEQKQNNLMAYFIFAKQGSCLREKGLRDSYHPDGVLKIIDKMEESGWELQGVLFITCKAEANNDKEYIDKMFRNFINKHGQLFS